MSAHIAGGIAIACLMPFLVLVLVHLFVPADYPGIKLYIGLIALIGLNFAIVLGYVRYQRRRLFMGREAQQIDSARSAKHRHFLVRRQWRHLRER
jgi:hypothetical protein